MITEISRAEALQAFAERHPGRPADEVEEIFSQRLQADCLDFERRPDGRWRVVLCSPRRRQ
jgi:hypothetical protein